MFWFPSAGHQRNCCFQILHFSRAYLRIIYEKIKGQILLGLSLGKQNWGVQALCIKTRKSAQPFVWKWFFILMLIKLNFNKTGCALGLILKVKVFGTGKWHISCCPVITKFRVQFHVKLGFWGSPHVRQSESWIMYSTPWFRIPGTGFWSQWNLDSGFWLLEGFLIPKPRIPVPQVKFPRFVIPQEKHFIGIRIPFLRAKRSCSTALNGCHSAVRITFTFSSLSLYPQYIHLIFLVIYSELTL